MITVGSLFAGIGGIDLGLERTGGFKTVWQVEIDGNANAVRKRHWPNVGGHEDVTTFTLDANPVRPDLICGGFPCQDLSVAGKRAGLAGSRSGLFHQFMRIVSERTPRWVLVENVPGLLSSNEGRDMGIVLTEMAKLGYGTAYRILDAQWFGVAQRRRRVFIVGCLGDWRRAAEVLFESESLPWNPPPSRETWQNCASPFASRSTAGGGHGTDFESSGGLVACGLTARYGKGVDSDVTDCLLPIAYRTSGNCGVMEQGSITAALNCGSDPNQTIIDGMFGVRRLTPREEERCFGFPDDWTRFKADGTEVSDSARYRMLGNAVAVPVAEWIGHRILESIR